MHSNHLKKTEIMLHTSLQNQISKDILLILRIYLYYKDNIDF